MVPRCWWFTLTSPLRYEPVVEIWETCAENSFLCRLKVCPILHEAISKWMIKWIPIWIPKWMIKQSNLCDNSQYTIPGKGGRGRFDKFKMANHRKKTIGRILPKNAMANFSYVFPCKIDRYGGECIERQFKTPFNFIAATSSALSGDGVYMEGRH